MIHITNCPLCESQRTGPVVALLSKPYAIYKRCVDCGLVFMSPRMSDYEMKLYYGSESYRLAMGQKFSQEWMDDNEKERSHRIADLVTEGKSVLDVGCSRGYILKELFERGYEVLGVEPNSAYVMNGIPFVMDIDNIAEGKQFDNITCIHTLEHVPDFKRICASMVKLLAPGGKLFVEVPGMGSNGGPYGSEHIYYFPKEVMLYIFKDLIFVDNVQTPHELFIFMRD